MAVATVNTGGSFGYGTTPAAQRASSVQATSALASSTDFGAAQTAIMLEVMNTLIAMGVWKGSA